jgi:calcineurin-like phosphoesterase family protein
MNLFFTADEHYGHDNYNGGIISMCNRPYANLDEMREDFIARHNAKVLPGMKDAVTVHLGDMFWRKLSTDECAGIVYRLNGGHVYINGNHEEVFNRSDSNRLRVMFQDIAEVKLLKVGKTLVWLSHYAHRVWPKSHNGSYHVYGHTHGVLPGHRRSMDVGVDANGYAPVSFDELDVRMKALGKLLPDEVERDMLDHPWPADSGSKLGEGLEVTSL